MAIEPDEKVLEQEDGRGHPDSSPFGTMPGPFPEGGANGQSLPPRDSTSGPESRPDDVSASSSLKLDHPDLKIDPPEGDETVQRLAALEQQLAAMQQLLLQQSQALQEIRSWSRRVEAAENLESPSVKESTPASLPTGGRSRPTGDIPRPGLPNSSAGRARGVAGRPTGRAPARPVKDIGADPRRQRSGLLRPGTDLESVIGGNWLSRLGAVSLILGLVFFFRLTSADTTSAEQSRVIFGGAMGLALLVAGEVTRRHGLGAYSHGLSGAGFASFYLTIVAAYDVYHLIGGWLAFAALAAVSFLTVARAITIDAEAVAALGLLWGFLTPVLLSHHGLSTGLASTKALFAYLGVLDAAVLAAACFKDWKGLKIGSLLLTQIFFVSWLMKDYSPDQLMAMTVAATGLFALFIGVAVAYHVIRGKAVDNADLYLILKNPTAYAALLMGYHYNRQSSKLGIYLMGIGLVYGLFALVARRRTGWNAALPVSFLAVAAGMLALGISLLFSDNPKIFTLAGEALVLFWGGCRFASYPLRSASYGLFCWLIVVVLITIGVWLRDFHLMKGTAEAFLWKVEIPLALTACVFVAGQWTTRHYKTIFVRAERPVEAFMGGSACVAGFLMLTLEILRRLNGLPPAEIGSWLSATWAIYAAGVLTIGVALKLGIIRRCAYGVYAVSGGALIYAAIGLMKPAYAMRLPFLLMILSVLVAEWATFRHRDALDRGEKPAATALAIGAYCAGFFWLTLEVLHLTHTGSRFAVSGWLSAAWAVYAAAPLPFGIGIRQRVPRLCGLVLLGLVILKVLVFDTWFLDYAYRLLSLFSLAAVLWGSSYLYAFYRDRIDQPAAP